MNLKNIGIIFILLIIIFTSGCSKDNENAQDTAPSVKPAPNELKLTPSTVPPTEQEIVKLSNGYQITSGLKTVIDQRCEASGLRGGDTGSGYGCVAT